MTAIFPGRGKRWYSSAAWSSCSSIASSLAVPPLDGVSFETAVASAEIEAPASPSSTPLGDVKIGDRPLQGLRRHADGLEQRRVRADRQADVLGVRPHL